MSPEISKNTRRCPVSELKVAVRVTEWLFRSSRTAMRNVSCTVPDPDNVRAPASQTPQPISCRGA
jgi:hypothetical protein